MSAFAENNLGAAAGRVIGKLFIILFLGVLGNIAFGIYFSLFAGSATYMARLLFLLLFVLFFPFSYLWRIRIFTLRIGILELYRSGEGIIEKVVKKWTLKYLEKKAVMGNRASSDLVEAGKESNKDLELRWPLNWVMNYLLRKIPLQETLREIGKEEPLSVENADVVGSKVFQAVDKFIEKDLIKGGMTRFLFLFCFNLAIMCVLYYYYIAINN